MSVKMMSETCDDCKYLDHMGYCYKMDTHLMLRHYAENCEHYQMSTRAFIENIECEVK